MNTLAMLVVILVVSRIFEEISERTRNPALLGDILAGFILGPSLLNVIEANGTLEFLGLIGVVFIMVLAGIEVNLKKAEKVTSSAAVIAAFAVAVPLILGMATALFFNLNMIEAAIVGISLTITASALVAEILDELKAITTKIGETIIVAGVFDDIIGLVTITALLISTESAVPGAGIAGYLVKIVLFFAVSAIAGYHLFPRVLEYSQDMKSPEAKFSLAIILVMSFVALAEIVGMSAIIGAFLAGLALNHYMNRKDKYGFEKDIKSIAEGFMAPVFFVLLGASITIPSFYTNLPFVIAIIIIALAGKITGGVLGSLLCGNSMNESFAVGTGMATRGAVTLVVAHIGHGIATKSPALVPNIELIYSAIIAMVFFVNLVNIPLLRYTLASARNRKRAPERTTAIETLKTHINNRK